MSFLGQLLGHKGREPIFPVIPEEGIHEVKYTNKRTNVARFLLKDFQERKLGRLADLWPSPSTS